MPVALNLEFMRCRFLGDVRYSRALASLSLVFPLRVRMLKSGAEREELTQLLTRGVNMMELRGHDAGIVWAGRCCA